jgi:hypothetical protein
MKDGNESVSFADIFDELDQMNEVEDIEAEETQRKMRSLIRRASVTFRKSLATLGLEDPERQISGIVITVPKLRRQEVDLIRGIYRSLGLDKIRAYLQDYKESFYYHTLYQQKEIWTRNVGFFHFCGRKVTFGSLNINNLTRPVTFRYVDGISIELSENKADWDEQFCQMIGACLGDGVYSSIILKDGGVFEISWAKRSIAMMRKNGRAVYGEENIFAKGACYAAREKAVEKRLGKYLYLGEDLARTNIGMQMVVQGKETYYPLLSAGINWYEAKKDFECILDGEQAELKFLLSSLEDRNRKISVMKLPGLDMTGRPSGTVRLGLHMYYKKAGCCVIEVEDLGFGEFFASTGMKWREELRC